MSDMRYHRTFHVFRQREEGVWTYMGEEQISSTVPIQTQAVSELVVRGYMGRSRNTGGVFSVVPVNEWSLIDARAVQAEIKPSSATMKKVAE